MKNDKIKSLLQEVKNRSGEEGNKRAVRVEEQILQDLNREFSAKENGKHSSFSVSSNVKTATK